jgi:hypothetical protein
MDVVGGGGSAKAPLPDEEIPWALLGVPLAILLLFLAGMIWATRTNREH